MDLSTPRVRTRTSVEDFPTSYKRKVWSKVTPTTPQSTYFVSTVSVEHRSGYSRTDERIEDWVTPDFKKLSRQGRIINNPLKINRETYYDRPRHQYFADYVRSPAYVWTTNDPNLDPPYIEMGIVGSENFGTLTSSTLLGDPTLSTSFAADPIINLVHAAEVATTKAYANIDLSRIDALVMAAEGRETVAFISHLMFDALKIFKMAWRLDLRRALLKAQSLKTYTNKHMHYKRKLDALANRYMECRYALRPLVSDVRNVLKLLEPNPVPDRYTFRGKYVEKGEVDSGEYLLTTGSYWKRYARKVTSREVTARAGVLTAIGNVSALQTFGLDNILESIWETIPLSFVADWFFNVGETIAALTPEYGVKELASWVTIEDKIVRRKFVTRNEVTYVPANPSQYYRYSITGCEIGHNSYNKERIVGVRPSIFPTTKVNLDAFKLLDLSIIIRQFSKKLS